MNETATNTNTGPLLLRVLFRPKETFEDLSRAEPSPYRIFFKYLVWFALLPPMFAYIGGSRYGWDLGAANPLILAEIQLRIVSMLYFFVLLTAFVSTAFASQWMSETYGARKSLGVHMAMVTILAVPMTVGSVVHLYPHVFINLLVFIPVLIWAMYLLYVGLPVALNIEPEKGMLMASSLVGWLLVGFVTLLGVTVALWTEGLGPSIGA